MKSSAPTIVWDDCLATGLADIDAQHQRLFEITNHLGFLYTSGTTAEQLSAVLADLKQYTDTHFQTEEALMNRYPVNPAHRELHLRAHQEFIRHIDRSRLLAIANSEASITMLLAFVAQWLLHHVANMDRLMATEILALQSGLSPEQATLRQQACSDALIENISEIYRSLGERTFQILELNLQLQSEIERRKQVEQELSDSKTRFRTVADHTHSWEYWQGTEGEIIYMSPSCERITGYTAEQFIATPEMLYQIVHPEDRHLLAAHEQHMAFEEHGEEEIGFRIVRRDGDVRWIIHACKALYDSDDQFLGRRGSNRDITDRRTQNDSMLLVATVFDAVNEAVVLTNEDRRIVVVNTAFTKITGYAPEDVIGKEPGMLEETPAAPEYVCDLWQTLTLSGRWQGEAVHRRKNGEIYAAALSIDSVHDDKGHISNFVLVFSDINELKANEKRIHYLANYDQLTGMPNWHLFSDRLQQAVSSARRNRTLLALMFVDIDHFKSAKDHLGHEAGDLLVKEVARRVQACLRESDTAARIGNDEFVVFMPGIESAQEAAQVAENMLWEIDQPFVLANHNFHASASIGIAIYPEHGNDTDQLMRNADLAVYQAKQAGGAIAVTYRTPGDWLVKLRSDKAPG